MFSQSYSNVVRSLVCTVGAIAVSTVLLFAAAGPAEASTAGYVPAGHIEFIDVVTTARPIAY